MRKSDNSSLRAKQIHVTSTEHQEISAGEFSSWLCAMRRVLLDDRGIDVACGSCVGCCKSSYFIHIKPDEQETLKRIQKELLFPAPGMPSGHRIMGYDKKGQCPMLIDGACSIYEHRPRTCRAYDCRIFAAAGILAGGKDKAIVNQRIGQWKFIYPSERDRAEHEAVQAAAAFIRNHERYFPRGWIPADPGQLAILAIKVFGIFLKKDCDTDAQKHLPSNAEVATAVVAESRRFDSMMQSI
jgi:Fe-S-cluster containining protein